MYLKRDNATNIKESCEPHGWDSDVVGGGAGLLIFWYFLDVM